MAQEGEEGYKAQLIQRKKAGDSEGAHKVQELMLLNEGQIEIAQCRIIQESLDGSPIEAPTKKSQTSDLPSKEDSPHRSTDDSIECDVALQYVAPGGRLEKELQTASNRYKARLEGLNLLIEQKTQLLNDSWWATSKGPVVAASIKAVCDEFQEIISITNPAAAKMSETEEYLQTNRLIRSNRTSTSIYLLHVLL